MDMKETSPLESGSQSVTPMFPSNRQQDQTEKEMVKDALHHAGNPWQPFYKFKHKSGQHDYQEVYRKFRSILNKVTSKNFVTLVEQANNLHVNTEGKLNGVVDLVHEKAIYEPNFSTIYAKLSSRLAQLSVPLPEQPGKEVNFRKLLLAKCQQEFESRRKLKERLKASSSTVDEIRAEKMKRRIRYRQLGNVIFIGELFKVNMVAESIIHHCIKRLLSERSEESLECFCGLLRTVGKHLEIAISRRTVQNNNVMDFYFFEVQKIIDAGFTSSRMRFMLEDLIELRANDWFPLRICNFFGPISRIFIEECNFQNSNYGRIRKDMQPLSNDMKEKIAFLVEQVSNADYEEATKYVTELANMYSAFMFVNLAIFQVIERHSQARHLLGHFFCFMVKNKILSLDEYCLGFSSVLKSVDDFSLDTPLIKEYIGEILAPMLEDSKLPLTFLKDVLAPCIPSQTSGDIIAAVLLLASKQKGTIRVAELWQASHLQWTDFLHCNSEKEFIESHKLEFLTSSVKAISNIEISVEEFKQHIKDLLKKAEDNGEIFDYIDANISKNAISEPSIIRALVLAIHEDVITVLKADFKLNQVQYKKRLPILCRYIHNNKNLEFETLNTIQYFLKLLNITSILRTEVLCQLFGILCHVDVISEDVIEAWKEMTDSNELEG